jgi:enoyl-CoA hydratase/carnithine racemase
MSITQFCLLSFGLLLQVLPVQAELTSESPSQYGTITHSQVGAVLNVLFDNNSTEINIYDNKIQSDLYDLVTQLQNDITVKVVVFRSANPDFFLAHGELTAREGKKA